MPAAGRAYLLAVFLLLLPALAPLLAATGFLVGLPISPFHLPATVLAAGLATAAVARAERARARDLILSLGLGLAVLGAAAAAGHLLLDLSYDGQAYHQTAIRHLAAGWNPLRRALTPAETIHGLWVNHYVRAVELGAAALMSATGSIEAGKAFGLLLPVPAALLLSLALRRAGVRRPAAVAAALLVAVNPIVLVQAPTFYLDGQLSLVFACALALAWLSLRGETRSAPVLLGLTVALLANMKFTATVYAGLLLAGYAAAALLRSRRRVAVPVALALAGTLLVGWQPLVTNALRDGHPFHPVAGPRRVDGLSPQTPGFRYRDPFRRLLESTFAETNAAKATPRLKLPFVVHADELDTCTRPDARIGGFGPLFGLGVLLAALGLAALPRGAAAGSAATAGIAAAVLATALVNPGAWWARFVPQLWIAGALAAAAAATGRRAARALGAAALLALATDAALVGAFTVGHQAKLQAAAVGQARELARRGVPVELPRGEMESLDLRLAREGVRARYVPACAPELPVAGAEASYCAPAAPANEPRSGRDPQPGPP